MFIAARFRGLSRRKGFSTNVHDNVAIPALTSVATPNNGQGLKLAPQKWLKICSTGKPQRKMP